MGRGGQSSSRASGTLMSKPYDPMEEIYAHFSCSSREFECCISELFEAQVKRTPQLVALQDPKGGLEYTYAQLNEAVDLLAFSLRQHMAVGDNVFGIFMERSAEYVVALLAVLKAGGAYSPIELAYPAQQIARVCDDLQAKVILTKSEYAAKLPSNEKLVLLDQSWQETLSKENNFQYDGYHSNTHSPRQDSLCYIVYSSGTTGIPKGVSAGHRSPVHSYLWRAKFSSYSPGDRVGCNVFFVWEVLRPLIFGATSVIIPDDTVYDPPAIMHFLEKHHITETLMTPSLLESILNAYEAESSCTLQHILRHLKVLWMNGEVVTAALRTRALAVLPQYTRLLNTYSISECGEVACLDLRTHFRPDLTPQVCPVGRPAPFVSIHLVVPGTLDPAPPGTVGELLIGGDGVGCGYFKRPELTEQRFFQFRGERVYRSGDLARVLEDGALEITGRCDSMVKVRGYSVVLGAVEAAMVKALGLKSVAVTVQGEEGSQHKRLVAYMVKIDSNQAATDGRVCHWNVDPETGRCPELTKVLQEELAHYAIPSVFMELDKLPLMPPPLVKVDLKKLPPPPPLPEASSLPMNFRLHLPSATQEELQDAVRLSMESVLNLPTGTMEWDSDFFVHGGHSLSCAALAGSLRTMLQTEVSIVMILENKTPANLAACIQAHASGASTEGAGKEESQKELVKTMKGNSKLDLSELVKGDRMERDEVKTVNSAKAVFLTGATGYFGAFLLWKILASSEDARVMCLVRGKDPRGALEKALRKFGVWEGCIESAMSCGRLNVVNGDLSAPLLGLVSEVRAQLANEIDLVFHCAAYVNLMLPYSSLHDANVEGTRSVIELAVEANAPLHYISTNAVFPWENLDGGVPWPEDLPLDSIPLEKLTTGYAQTKWVAEQMVWAASEKGLPVAVYRPGNLGGDTVKGYFNPSDANMLVLAACIRLGSAPLVDGWKLEMTPVDFAAEAVVNLASHEKTYGQAFNLVNPRHLDVEEVFEVMRDEGYEISRESTENWLARLRADKENSDANAAVEALLDDEEVWIPCKFSTSNFDYALKHHGITRPDLNGDLIHLYLQRMMETRLIPSFPHIGVNLSPVKPYKHTGVDMSDFAMIEV